MFGSRRFIHDFTGQFTLTCRSCIVVLSSVHVRRNRREEMRNVYNVFVFYFAKSVELTGVKQEEVTAVPTPITSRDLWNLLVQRHPRLSILQDHVVLAVRQQYVDIGDQVVTLGDGDEVAVVPPLSGG
ncbi:molybdopterin synthase sulfur carrier subunit isoform X1 [Paralichthys olivaceus]|uniref:molybdopterin synthase sulfur carrier subunit isoform X1 n=1 Tax=Paralichthys olivaceus TaxID=8255 RepID=UPI00374FDE0F